MRSGVAQQIKSALRWTLALPALTSITLKSCLRSPSALSSNCALVNASVSQIGPSGSGMGVALSLL